MSNVEYCSFIGEDLLICECGENFPDEQSLRSHLESDHDRNGEIEIPTEDQTSNTQLRFLDSGPVIEIKTEADSEDEETEESNLEVSRTWFQTKQENAPVKYIENAPVKFIVTSSPARRVVSFRQNLSQAVMLADGSEHSYGKETPKPAIQECVCELCGTSFNSTRALKLHANRHRPPGEGGLGPRGGRKYAGTTVVCDVCGKNFKSSAALRYHTRIHTGEKPYQCTYCPKAFTMPLFLQIHVRTHTGERPYPCRLCEKKFSSRAALARHERVHTGDKPYECQHCGKAFSQSNSMKLHITTVHLKLPSPYKSHSRLARQQKRLEQAVRMEKMNIATKILAQQKRERACISMEAEDEYYSD